MSNGKIIVGNIQDFEFFLEKYELLKNKNDNYVLISSNKSIFISHLENRKVLKLSSTVSLAAYIKENSKNFNTDIFCITALNKTDELYNLVHGLIEDMYKVSKNFNFFYHCNDISEILNTRLLDKCTDIIILKDLTEQDEIIIRNTTLFNNKNIIYLNRYRHKNIIKSELIKLFSNTIIQKKANVKKIQKKDIVPALDIIDSNKEDILVSEDRRVPPIIKAKYKYMSKEEFLKQAATEEGINFNGKLVMNIDSLDKELYNALSYNNDHRFQIIFYTFEDQPNNLNFLIPEGIETYKDSDTICKIKDEEVLFEENINRPEFLRLDENNLMFITHPGRMGDEDGTTFIMKDNDWFKEYRVEYWTKDPNPSWYISSDDVEYKFSKYMQTLSNIDHSQITKENNFTYIDDNNDYAYIYMGFGNSLCVNKSIYDEFKLYLDKIIIEDRINCKKEGKKDDFKPGDIFRLWKKAVNLMLLARKS